MEEQVVNYEEQGKVDQEVKDALKVELGISNAKEMGRTELNFYCEFLMQMKALNNQLGNLHQTLNMIGADKLTQYFKELTNNVKKEETVQKVQQKIKQSHK